MADEVSPDLVLLDLRLPDMDGMDVLRALRSRYPEVAVIIITGFGQIQSAVEAIKVGATDYLEKPFEHVEKLKLAVGRALDEVRAKREIRRLHGLQEKQYGVDQIIGDSEPTRSLRDLIRKRSEEHTSELQSQSNLVCRLLLEKKKTKHPENPCRTQTTNPAKCQSRSSSSRDTPFPPQRTSRCRST